MKSSRNADGGASSVLVTGGTGFLGRRLVERLLALGRSVTVLARTAIPELEVRGVRFIRTSLEQPDAVAAACEGIGTVFHVAAKVGVWGDYSDYYRVNVLGTRAVLEGCRRHGVRRLVHTSTPSVVYNGCDLAGASEALPLTTRCPSSYPLTKALAEREVLAANGPELRTIALRPHLIWGAGDPHLVPRVLAQARAGRLRIVGTGTNRVDLVHVENVVDAHLRAEAVLRAESTAGAAGERMGTSPTTGAGRAAANSSGASPAGRAYFITNGEPVVLWDWINRLLQALDDPPVRKRIPLPVAVAAGAACELVWRLLRLKREPPMTRFVATELARDHWFDISAARRDLDYQPRISMTEGTAELIESLRRSRTAP